MALKINDGLSGVYTSSIVPESRPMNMAGMNPMAVSTMATTKLDSGMKAMQERLATSKKQRPMKPPTPRQRTKPDFAKAIGGKV